MSTRLATGGRLLDKSQTLNFTFNGKQLRGVAGDTLASALLGAVFGVTAALAIGFLVWGGVSTCTISGRASASILDQVMVEAYGSTSPVNARSASSALSYTNPDVR